MKRITTHIIALLIGALLSTSADIIIRKSQPVHTCPKQQPCPEQYNFREMVHITTSYGLHIDNNNQDSIELYRVKYRIGE